MSNTTDYFNEPVAALYDADVEDMFDSAVVDPVVDQLQKLCAENGALEFGVGTGRIASPLSQRGVAVTGIDLSDAMMRRVSGKPNADKIKLVQGDFSCTSVDGSFDLVYLVFNTLMNLTSQEAQLACFQNAANHLVPGGHFVVEVMMPRLQWLNPGSKHMVWDFSAQHRGIDEYDLATQGLISHHTFSREGKETSSSIPFRYVWPGELDLMAKLSGMTLQSRWEDWSGSKFTHDSENQIVVWRKEISDAVRSN